MIAATSHFRLFANCIPVKGANRSVICDLQRQHLDFIPNVLYDILTEHRKATIGELRQLFGVENEKVLDSYFQFLLDKEYLFLCTEEELQLFPDLDLSWEVPNDIENAIIDTDLNSQHYNSCLNHKIAVDAQGQIKNCPSMSDSFGHINDTTLQMALADKKFKRTWSISKDQIDTCRDCEFRHICTDCRAFLEQANDPFSKPLKCGYDPYTNEWTEWSEHPMKQQAMGYYGFSELVD